MKSFWINKTIIITSILLLSNSLLFAQGGKIDNKGLRQGKWEIVYNINDKIAYIAKSDIPDWLNSIKPSDDNGSSLIKSANSGAYGSYGTKFIFEKCNYKDGVKQGKFSLIYYIYDGQERIDNSIYSNGATRAKWKTIEIMSGEYTNGNLNGNIISYMNDNLAISIKYNNGILEDQIIKTKQVASKKLNIVINPYYKFKNNSLTEALFLQDELPNLSYSDGKNGYLLKYTYKPYCYNEFSFLTKEEIEKNQSFSLINLNTNNLAIEYVPFKYNNENKMVIDGNYRLYKPSAILLDTTFLWASYHFKNNKREGLAEIWDASKNGKTGIAPFIKMNFFNDKLHGYSEMFYPDGKLAVSAEFKNGYPDGEVIAYNYPPNHYPFEPNYHIKAWVHSGGLLSIHQIGDFSKSIYENIETVKKNGGTFEEPKQYELYTKIKYKVDSMATNGKWFKGSVPAEDFYQFCNGKPITKYFINKEKPWIPSELFYFDSKGTVVYSLSKAKGEVIKKAIEIEAENQKYLNTEVKCAACNNKVLIKNAKENWGGCDCIQNNGERIEVYGTVRTYFCSIQCKVIYEKDCCKRNGYFYER